CKFPVASSLLPNDDVLSSYFARCRPPRLQAEGAYLARGRGAEYLDIQRREFRIADSFGNAFPQFSNCGSALYHRGPWWEHGRISSVKRRNAGEITLVEKFNPLCVDRVNVSPLRKRRCDQPQCERNG